MHTSSVGCLSFVRLLQRSQIALVTEHSLTHPLCCCVFLPCSQKGVVTVIGAGNEEAATVVDNDVLVGKGVVHVIDRALGECGLLPCAS